MENENEEPATASAEEPTPEDTAALEKAVRFWKHPSLAAVPVQEKIKYLHSRGLSEAQVHRVWEMLAEEPPTTQQTKEPPRMTESHTMPAAPHPQQQQQYQGNTFPNSTMEPYSYPAQPSLAEDSTFVPTLLAVGGALGLTAAAAVRWLNGGDFELFPSATRRQEENHEDETAVQRSEGEIAQVTTPSPVARENNDQQVEEIEHDYILKDDKETVGHHDDKVVQDLINVVEKHCSTQERILQQLSNFTTKQVTDQSMNLLRQQQKEGDLAVMEKLVEIQTELTSLKSENTSKEGRSSAWETRVMECMDQLQECIQKVKPQTTNQVRINVDGTNNDPILNNGSLSAFQASSAVSSIEQASTSESSSKIVFALREAICRLAQENESTRLRAGAQILYLYVINLSSHPHVPRYRKIFTSNDSFKKVESLTGGKELLFAVGFVEAGNCLEWSPPGSEEEAVTHLKEVAAALSILKTHADDPQFLTTNALSVLPAARRPSTPPPNGELQSALLQTPQEAFIASPPSTKKHPFLSEAPADADESILDISSASEHFESRLQSLAQPVIDDSQGDTRLFDAPSQDESFGTTLNTDPRTSLPMRESGSSKEEPAGKEENGSE